MHLSSTISSLALIAIASAKVIDVAVGQNGLTYTPSDIHADIGDTVQFTFFPKNHTVTQSSFAAPCVPLKAGFFSSFVPVASAATANTTFSISINDTKAIWLYCGQNTGAHCQAGMVASINAPVSGNTLAAFILLAKNTTISSSPAGGAVGGILKVAGGGSSSVMSSATKTVTTTITAFVTSAGSSYSTTYGTTYTTAVAAPVSSTSSAASSSSSAAAVEGRGKVAGGVVGAAGLVAWALL